MWGRSIQASADQNPIVRPPPRPADGKIRLGLMSSDLRNHPVGYFALPLFDFTDDRFELYCYSFNRGAEDPGQKYFASKSKAFRWNPTMSDRDAAQMIADDQLDMLIELGGSTHMNKLDVMAYRPARLSASWLGYPHSAGLEAIDYIVVDPYMTPRDPRLLIEKPMTMPHTWLALGRGQFREQPEVDPTCPEERNGFITFGTANQPNKYNAELLNLWARVLAAVPNSQFLFVRPEGSGATFRENMRKHFAMEGVAPERIRFQPIRGAHLPFYNEMDITLDTAPLTGGTTTCESLWMGVPVISLIGEALFERLSYSILTNAGLGDLAADSQDAYVATAVKLAGDAPRRKALRAGLRDQIKASTLGQTQVFAKDFYDMVAATVAARR
jgi:predicted O-linked N-acetylglucosamine transferase (SPINDLY family)